MRAGYLLLLLASHVAASSVCVVQSCAPKNLVADFVFAIDVSNALGNDGFYAVKEMLYNFTSSLRIGPTTSQVALYTYASRARSSGTLTQLSSLSAVQSAINNLQYDNTEDRKLLQVFNLEESEVTPANGFRPNAKHVFVVLAADEFTGQSPFTQVLDKIRAKYDMILAVGIGEQAIRNNYEDMKQLAGGVSDVFWAFNLDHLPYSQLWIGTNACPNSHLPPTTAIPTTVPTPPPSVPCSVSSLNYDVYLLVDTSATVSAADFAAMKQAVNDFVSVYPTGDNGMNFGLITVSVDTQVFYTGFHNSQERAALLSDIGYLNQDGGDGQTLDLALKAVRAVFLGDQFKAANKLVVYFSGNTNFDTDPSGDAAQLFTQYGVQYVAVKWTSNADASKLQSVTGGSQCVYDATSNRSGTAAWLQAALCNKNFCRS